MPLGAGRVLFHAEAATTVVPDFQCPWRQAAGELFSAGGPWPGAQSSSLVTLVGVREVGVGGKGRERKGWCREGGERGSFSCLRSAQFWSRPRRKSKSESESMRIHCFMWTHVAWGFYSFEFKNWQTNLKNSINALVASIASQTESDTDWQIGWATATGNQTDWFSHWQYNASCWLGNKLMLIFCHAGEKIC